IRRSKRSCRAGRAISAPSGPTNSASGRKRPSTRSSRPTLTMNSAAASPRKARAMLLGCIADDFTRASDLANTLAKGGMATVQFVGVPKASDPADCDAGVVALKTRSIAAADAVTQSLAALDWLKDQGCRQFLFKYCSTFDSTPDGNIGPV